MKNKRQLKRKHSIGDYLICMIGVLFILTYFVVGFSPISTSEHSTTEQVNSDTTDLDQTAEQNVSETELDSEEVESSLGYMTVTFIDVGQGDSTLVVLPDGATMLIDSGEASASQTVINTLNDAKVEQIDYLVATHPHADHIGGMEAVLSSFDVKSVWAPDVTTTTATYEGFIDAVDDENLPIDEAAADKVIVDEELGYSIELLGPAEETNSSDLNDYSAIIRLNYGDTTFLFTGDAPAQEIIDASPGHVDVLKASHHGSETGTDTAVVVETTPEYFVMSYADGNSYGHPDQSVLDAVTVTGTEIYSTAVNGNITFTSDGKEIEISTESEGEIVAGLSAYEKSQQETETQTQEQEQTQEQAQNQKQTQNQDQNKTVVITPSGSKYHYSGCRTLSRSKSLTELTESEAVSQGYEACNVCSP